MRIFLDSEAYVTAVIVAAGQSTRMGGVNKIFLPLGTSTVIEQTVKAFSLCARIDEIVLATREDCIERLQKLCRENGFTKVKAVVAGGQTRAESVQNAMQAASQKTTHFAIHDGARPLVTQEILQETIETALQTGAAATGVRVKDTIKVVNADGVITDTPERSTLWAVHTPQVFLKEAYLDALQSVPGSRDFTDDCKLLEAAGCAVQMVEGSYENLKLTTPEDLCLAEAILKRRETE